ncbi:MAG: OmpA family protein [Campylobacterales bacterium]|nr:OmpA family protein [Campylobacterales bacterium]
MLNKFIFGSAVAAAIIFTGCSSKSPEVASNTQASTPAASSSAAASQSTAPAVDAVADAQSKVQTVLFDFDKFNIRADMQAIAEANAKVVGGVSAKVKLEGNADERGTDEYNYALGLKRANSVKEAYKAKGVAEASMSTVSFGEGNPVCKESTEDCWAKNRRVDTKLEK